MTCLSPVIQPVATSAAVVMPAATRNCHRCCVHQPTKAVVERRVASGSVKVHEA
jgi:hypothetical protein